jgi:AcrR family transcriptional regulator
MEEVDFMETDRKDRSPYRRRERREAILRAATEAFLEKGYEGAGIDDIIQRVGGSKRTIYGYFGNKEGLFAAVVTENTERALGPLSREDLHGNDLSSTLLRFGLRYLELLMTPTALGLYRVVVAEGARFPRLAEAFFESGPGRASEMLAETLREFRRAREVRAEDFRPAAEKFVGMVRDDLHLRVVLGLRRPPDREEAEESVRRAVEIFVGGWTPGGETDGCEAASLMSASGK